MSQEESEELSLRSSLSFVFVAKRRNPSVLRWQALCQLPPRFQPTIPGWTLGHSTPLTRRFPSRQGTSPELPDQHCCLQPRRMPFTSAERALSNAWVGNVHLAHVADPESTEIAGLLLDPSPQLPSPVSLLRNKTNRTLVQRHPLLYFLRSSLNPGFHLKNSPVCL